MRLGRAVRAFDAWMTMAGVDAVQQPMEERWKMFLSVHPVPRVLPGMLPLGSRPAATASSPLGGPAATRSGVVCTPAPHHRPEGVTLTREDERRTRRLRLRLVPLGGRPPLVHAPAYQSTGGCNGR